MFSVKKTFKPGAGTHDVPKLFRSSAFLTAHELNPPPPSPKDGNYEIQYKQLGEACPHLKASTCSS